MNRYFTVKRLNDTPLRIEFEESMNDFVDRKLNPEYADQWYRKIKRMVTNYLTDGKGVIEDCPYDEDNFSVTLWFMSKPGEVLNDHVWMDLVWWDDPIEFDPPIDLNPWETGVKEAWMHIVLYSQDS